MCDKACISILIVFAPNCYKTQKKCVIKLLILIILLCKLFLRHRSQEIYNKAADTCLLALKFISDWFVTNKIFEKLDNVIFSDDYKDLDDVDSDIVTSFSDGMSLVIIDLNNINLDDDNFDEDDPETIILF